MDVGGSPSTERPRFSNVAPTYEIVPAAAAQPQSGSPAEEAVRMLVELLSKDSSIKAESLTGRSGGRRKLLVCASERLREKLARCLTEDGYHVHVAADTRQAIDTMRANLLQVVILDPDFDLSEQGSAFVVREINVLRPPQRRRIFFVLISTSLRSLDAHAAFLNNVNAVVNVNDLAELPRILEVALREYNELYKEYNDAFELVAI